MASLPGDGRLHYGEPLCFDDNGSITTLRGPQETVTTVSNESPLQVRRPQPLSSFDREPVLIPSGHPLAASTPKSDEEKEALGKRRLIMKQRKCMRLLTERLRQSTAVTIEMLKNGEQTLAAREQFNEDRIREAEAAVAALEERILREKADIEKFMELCNKTMDKVTRPSMILHSLMKKLEKMEEFKEKHEEVARMIRMNYNTVLELADTLARVDAIQAKIRECKYLEETEKDAESLELSLALNGVQDSLKTIKDLASNIFKTESNPVGLLLQEAVARIRYVDSEMVQKLPALREPTGLSTASTATSLLSSVSQEMGVDVTTASTQPSHHIRLDSWPSASFRSDVITTDASTYHSAKSPAMEEELMVSVADASV